MSAIVKRRARASGARSLPDVYFETFDNLLSMMPVCPGMI